VPEAELRLGDLQALPYPDDSFDVVTGFTSFFFADDIVAALREAGRVARAGAPVVTWAYADAEALMKGMLAAGGAGAVAGADGQLRLRAAILAALADCRRPDGSYSVSNEWHFFLARA
jgi:Methyltransferase domain